jgi:hypothetical protein
VHQPIEHKVRLAELSALERRHLKEAFVVIRQIQDVIRANWHLERISSRLLGMNMTPQRMLRISRKTGTQWLRDPKAVQPTAMASDYGQVHG